MKQNAAAPLDPGKKAPVALVADDNALIREILTDILTDEGFEVHRAEHGEDALQKTLSGDHDLIFLDLDMPVLDGMSYLRELRRRKVDREVVVVTADSHIETAIEAVRLGARDYIRKPINREELLECAGRIMESARMKSLLREHQHQLEKKVVEQEDRIRFLFYEAIESLVYAIEAKDEYTKGHSMRVTAYAAWLTSAMDLTFEEASHIHLAARLHDIGKLGVADSILNKRGPLTREEFSVIKQHPERGCRILTPIIPDEPLKAILHHHERWDGGGYPSRLKMDEIPLEARVISLCDAFDAMTSERVYREKLDPGPALAEIDRCSGSQFDPELAPVFIGAVEKNINIH